MLFLLQNNNEIGVVNIGFGKDISIKELAQLVASKVEYVGELVFDNLKPDGTMRKILDCSRINKLGWIPKINLHEGIAKTILEFKNLIDE